MLEDAAPLDERNHFEMAARDVEAHKRVESNEITALSEIDRMELPTTLGQLGKTDGRSLLEIGCGTGRYTRPLAERCNSILAVDFSKSRSSQMQGLYPKTGTWGLFGRMPAT